jgi:hypothetical protein
MCYSKFGQIESPVRWLAGRTGFIEPEYECGRHEQVSRRLSQLSLEVSLRFFMAVVRLEH